MSAVSAERVSAGDRAVAGRLVGSVLTSDDVDQSVRWTPGERLQHLFEERCDRFRVDGDAGHLAVARGGFALTYDELDARANRMARFLLDQGSRPGHRLGLMFDDAVASYVGMLATLKINAAYVPLDAAFPPDRLAYIVKDAGVSAVLSLARLREQLGEVDARVVCVDEVQALIRARSAERLTAVEHGTPVEDLCYIVYTSGTTGRPKGVPIEHASICNFVRVAGEVYGVLPQDRMYQGMTIAFDFSVEEIWVPLVVGATLVPKPGSNLLGEELAEFLREEDVTALCCVPTLLATMDDDLPGLRFLLVSGEACPQDLVGRWHRRDRRFLNVYGPTETTVTATWTTLRPDQPVTIGVPLPTYAVVILDEHDQTPLPPGQLGEIGIAGVGLSPGYLHRDDLTGNAFLPDPVGIPHNTSGRIYRSGDLGRITEDGLVECLGRIDTQVKIRGYRIELTEIESLLLCVPGIAAAVVDTHEPGPGSVELVAYYTVRPAGPPVDAENLQEALRRRLPRYMVPAYFERLDRIPMLPSDKADRKNLPSPSGRRLAVQGEHAAPANEVEEVLAAAVADLLGLERVSVESNFFDDLGMSSLTLAQLRARLRDRPELPSIGMKDAYLNPSVRALAAALHGAAPRARQTRVREVRVAGTAAYLLCGAAQALLYVGAAYLLLLVIVTGYGWTAAATGLVDLYLRVLAAGASLFLGTSLLPVAAKWLLVGRFEAEVIPIWGLRYLRFWVVRQLIRASPMALFAGSPLYLLYLRSLGARIGRDVVVFARAVPVCTDLLRIGDGAVIRKDAIFPGYRAESGWIRTGRIDVGSGALVCEGTVLDVDSSLGAGAQLGHASSLRAGQHVPAGKRYGGSPAQEMGSDFAGIESGGCSRRRRVVYSAFQLAVLALVTAPLLMAVPLVVVPTVYAAFTAPAGAGMIDWTSPAFYLRYLMIAGVLLFGVMLARLAVLVTVPRLLSRLVTPDTPHPLYGVRYAALRLTGRLGNSALFNDLLGDSSFIVYFFRAIGYDLSRVQQTGSNFGLAVKHDSPLHVRVGTGTLVSDGLSLMNADYSNSSFVVSRVAIGGRSFLGNNIAYPARSVVGDDCLLATKVMVPIDGPVREGVGLLGSPAFEIPRSTQGDATLDRYRTGPELRARLARKNRSNLATMGVFLLQRLLLLYGTVLLALAAHGLVGGLGVGAYVLGVVAVLGYGMVSAVLFERLSMGMRRLSPRFCSIYQPYYWRHERLWKLSRISVLTLFNGTPFKSGLWRMLGVRMGRKVFDDGAIIPEKTLVTIGDHATINTGTVIQCHSLEDASFTSDRTEIGAGVTLGINSFVHYGVRMGDRVVLDADAFLMKGEEPASDTRWRGNPATEVPDADEATPTPRLRALSGPAAADSPARRSPLAALAVAAFGVLAAVQIASAAARLPSPPGESRLVDGAFAAVLGLPGSWSVTAGFGDLAARAQLWAYAGLTGAFDRYGTVVGGARELAVAAGAVLLVAVVAAAWRLRVRPSAVAAVLGLLAVCWPAVAALATFGPGLLGVMWIAVGAALLSRTAATPRVLGVLAVVAGIATAPLLGVAVAVAVAVVAGGFASSGLRVLGATALSLLVVAAVPWPGADTAVPALVVAVLVLAMALVHELVGELAQRPLRVRGGVLGLALAAWAVVLVVVPAGIPAMRDDTPHRALAIWLGSATDPAATVTVPPGVWSDLVRDGVPVQRLAPGGALVVAVGPVPDQVGLARFGQGAEQVSVRSADASVPTAGSPALVAAGTRLAGNPNLIAPPDVRAALQRGEVDPRALLVLAGLTGRAPVTVTGLPVVPGEEPAVPRHQVALAGLDEATRQWLAAQQPPYAPTVSEIAGVISLSWPVPAPPTLFTG